MPTNVNMSRSYQCVWNKSTLPPTNRFQVFFANIIWWTLTNETNSNQIKSKQLLYFITSWEVALNVTETVPGIKGGGVIMEW